MLLLLLLLLVMGRGVEEGQLLREQEVVVGSEHVELDGAVEGGEVVLGLVQEHLLEIGRSPPD